MNTTRGFPGKIWLVALPSGERHLVDRPFLEGIENWAHGTDATIAEYRLEKVTAPTPKEPKP